MNKDRFVSVVVALFGTAIVVGLYHFYYQSTYSRIYNQYLVGNLIGLFWLPMISILFLIRESPEKYGLSICSSKRIWTIVGISFAGLLVLMLTVARWQVYQDYYPLFKRYPEFISVFSNYPKENPFVSAPLLMLYAEVSYGMYLFCWEFFFRGYLLFGLSRSIGWGAIIVQAAAFGLLHLGKPVTEVVASFGAGVILGIIALNAKSFVPGFVLHWAASLTFDVFVVAWRS